MSENRRERIEAFEEEAENEDSKGNRKRYQKSSQKNISKAPIKIYKHKISVKK